jgi:hypothetical protein
MRGILQTWCQVQRTSSSLCYVNCGAGHLQCNYSSAYSGLNIQLNASALLLEISRKCYARFTANLVPNKPHIPQIMLSGLWSRTYTMQIQFRIFWLQHSMNVSALILETYRQLSVRYTANSEPNTAYIIQFTECVLWSRKYSMDLQLLIFRQLYSSERICAAIGHIPTFRCALYWKFGVKYRAHRLVYAAWTVVPYIYNVITAPLIQASIFNWTYLRCYWRYADIWKRVILQIWCHI